MMRFTKMKNARKQKVGTLARTTREAAALDEFSSQGCSLLGSPPHRLPPPDHQPTESTNTETLFVSAPSMFHATQVYTPERERLSKYLNHVSISCIYVKQISV